MDKKRLLAESNSNERFKNAIAAVTDVNATFTKENLAS